jgi:hypothetical protein
MAAVYGDRPPWHDVQLMIQGPAVGDVEAVFRERWEDPAPLTRNPVARLHDLISHADDNARRLPPQRPGPPPCGGHAVQLLRTYPFRRPGYDFAPAGERSIARGYLKVLPRARSLIYLEDQYLWSTTVVSALARALRRNPLLRLIAVIPRYPDQDGRLSLPPNLVGRVAALALLYRAGGDRGPPPGSTPGTPGGGAETGRPGSCAATPRPGCRPGPGPGRRCPTGSSTTPTDGRGRGAGPAGSDGFGPHASDCNGKIAGKPSAKE